MKRTASTLAKNPITKKPRVENDDQQTSLNNIPKDVTKSILAFSTSQDKTTRWVIRLAQTCQQQYEIFVDFAYHHLYAYTLQTPASSLWPSLNKKYLSICPIYHYLPLPLNFLKINDTSYTIEYSKELKEIYKNLKGNIRIAINTLAAQLHSAEIYPEYSNPKSHKTFLFKIPSIDVSISSETPEGRDLLRQITRQCITHGHPFATTRLPIFKHLLSIDLCYYYSLKSQYCKNEFIKTIKLFCDYNYAIPRNVSIFRNYLNNIFDEYNSNNEPNELNNNLFEEFKPYLMQAMAHKDTAIIHLFHKFRDYYFTKNEYIEIKNFYTEIIKDYKEKTNEHSDYDKSVYLDACLHLINHLIIIIKEKIALEADKDFDAIKSVIIDDIQNNAGDSLTNLTESLYLLILLSIKKLIDLNNNDLNLIKEFLLTEFYNDFSDEAALLFLQSNRDPLFSEEYFLALIKFLTQFDPNTEDPMNSANDIYDFQQARFQQLDQILTQKLTTIKPKHLAQLNELITTVINFSKTDNNYYEQITTDKSLMSFLEHIKTYLQSDTQLSEKDRSKTSLLISELEELISPLKQ